MRDIEFRAWYVEGEMMRDVMNINFYGEELDTYEFQGDWLRFDEVVLMQYTGLKDKNGNKIYEGDIVKSTAYKHKYGVIKFGKYKQCDMSNEYECGNLGFYVEFADQHQLLREDIYFWYGMGIEVIGNIYVNPELLKE